MALPVFAQSWDELKGLKPGQSVRVEERDGTKGSGELKSVSDLAIRYVSSSGELEIERAKVKRVEVKSPERRLRNVLIGAAIGAAIGVVVDQTLGTRLRNEGTDSQAVTYATTITGAAAIGAMIAPYKTVYRAR